jgi:hypothetical protein
MTDLLIPAIAAGGVYLLATQTGVFQPAGDTAYRDPRYGATTGDILQGNPNGGYSYDPWLDDGGQSAFNIDGRLLDPDARQKLDLLHLAMNKTFDSLSSAGKMAAADKLNQTLQLDPPLRGNETWEQVSRVAGSAVGGVACNAIPGIGTAASPLCAMAGAYLGVELEHWMATEMPGLQSWITENIGGVISSIGDQIEDWFHDIF